MHMSLGCGLSFRQEPQLSQRLEQKLAHKQALTLRLSLVQRLARKIRGAEEDYRPKGTCPKCDRRLTPAEIVLGFNRNPTDVTTKCPRCKHRFAPILFAARLAGASSVEMPFYCPTQTLAMLKPEMASVAFDEFKKEYTAIYRSAAYHFGSLKAAFAKINLTYKLEPRISAWQKKVLSFLGKLPDAVIASNARTTVRAVRKLRKEKGIGPYRRS